MKPSLVLRMLSLIACLAGVSAHAQQAAELVGQVLDPSGAVVAAASVSATNEQTGVERATTSNEVGTYRLAPLQPGRYSIAVSASGFSKSLTTGLVLQVNQVARLDVTLEIGQLTEITTVEAEVPVVASENSTVGQVIDNKTIIELPMNGRNFLDLARLTPGVSQATGAAGGVFINGGGSQSASLMQLDGVDNFEAPFGRPNILPSVDMIQEFKIQSATYDATQGRAAIGQINVISKGGTNEFHGSAYEFHRNAAVAALNTFDLSREQRKEAGLSEVPTFIRNQFGASIGGPIVKNRTFFFGNYEGNLIRQVVRGVLTVPDAALRAGDFSQRTPVVYDPMTLDSATNQRLPFPNNQIPATRIDNVSSNYLGFTPAPNGPGFFNNYTSTIGQSDDIHQYTGKIDHHFSSNAITSGRYTYNQRDSLVPGFLGNVLFPGFAENQNFPAQNISLRHTQIFSPQTVFEVLLGYNRFFQNRYHEHQGQDIGAELGLAEQSGLPESQRIGGFPTLSVSGFAMPLEHAFAPLAQADNHYQFYSKLSHEMTRHSLKVGFELAHKRSPLRFHSNDRGTYNFSPRYTTAAPLASGGPENAFGDFLLGSLTSTNRGIGFPDNTTYSSWWSWFVHDDWRVLPNLTLNLGVRHEIYSGIYERFDRFNTFCFDIVAYCPVAQNGIPRAGYPVDKNNFAPRFGFAWRVFGNNKTVVRGGYGIFYDYRIANSFFNMNQSPPWQFQDPRQSDADIPNLTFQSPFPGPLPSTPTAADATTGTAVANNLKVGYVHQWSLGIQREILSDTVLDVSYVANRAISTVDAYNPSFLFPGFESPAARRVYPRIVSMSYVSNTGQSWYDSLQVRLERRFSRGFNVEAAYTWGHSLAIGCVVGSQNECQGYRNPTNFHSDKGSGPQDIRQRLVISGILELPFGRGRKFWTDAPKAADLIVGGWQFSAIATFQTGSPLTPSLSFDNSNAGGNRPDQIGDPMENAQQTLGNWFDASAFVNPPTLQQVLDSGDDPWRAQGNAGRGSIIGPGLNLWDLGLMKRFTIVEGHTIQFRAEFFNAWNHPSFGSPNTSFPFVPNSTGVIRSTSVPNRTIQFALRYDF